MGKLPLLTLKSAGGGGRTVGGARCHETVVMKQSMDPSSHDLCTFKTLRLFQHTFGAHPSTFPNRLSRDSFNSWLGGLPIGCAISGCVETFMEKTVSVQNMS